VDVAVNLDDQPKLGAEEVNDIVVNRLLTAPFPAAELPRTQTGPER
jgi:hypothetical protein